MPIVTRALGDLAIDTRTAGKPGPTPNDFLKKQLQATQPRAIIEAIVAATFQGKADLAADIARSPLQRARADTPHRLPGSCQA